MGADMANIERGGNYGNQHTGGLPKSKMDLGSEERKYTRHEAAKSPQPSLVGQRVRQVRSRASSQAQGALGGAGGGKRKWLNLRHFTGNWPR